MNYYDVKTSADAHRAALRREAEQARLAGNPDGGRGSLLAVCLEINVGRLAHWRLQWGTSGETKVSYDPIPNCG